MQNINVNIVPDSYPQTIRYSQGDVGREFKINVVGFTIPTGATVKIQATKPSGFGFSVAGTVVGNAVSFTTTAIMTDEAGRFPAELEITKDSVVIGTANFIMWGEANPHPEGTTDGQQGTIIPELTLLVERVEAAASSVLDMEVVANTLPAGSQATYSYDEDLNKATFGIPQGEAGAGAAGVVASAYSASATYKVGDYVIHNSNLYRCTTAITTAEAFTAAHWTQIVLADDVSDLKTDLIYDNSYSFVTANNPSVDVVDSGVTYEWLDKKTAYAHGTSTDTAVSEIYKNTTALPYGMKQGESYIVRFKRTSGTTKYVELKIFYYANGSIVQRDTFGANGVTTVPSNADGAIIRLSCTSGVTINETVVVDVSTAVSNKELGRFSKYYLEPTGDTTDRANEINALLTANKKVVLLDGNYYVSNITMPDNTEICGSGNSSKIIMLNGSTGSAITTGENCSVHDVAFEGGLNDINLLPNFIQDETSAQIQFNWINDTQCEIQGTSDDTAINRFFYNKTAMPSGIVAGKKYKIKISSTESSSYVRFFTMYYKNGTSYGYTMYGADTVITIPSDAEGMFFGLTIGGDLTIDETVTVEFLYAEPHNRNAIYTPSHVGNVKLSNLTIKDFVGCGIKCYDTGMAELVSVFCENIFITNCVFGVYMDYRAEYGTFSNVVCIYNYCGVRNDGGNNKFTSCGFEENEIGMSIDGTDLEANNNGHGACCSCSFNHNAINISIIKMTNGFTFSGCDIFADTMWSVYVYMSGGIVFSGCNFGSNTSLSLTGGVCNIFIGCFITSLKTSVVTPNNIENAIKAINCYTILGEAISFA